jgi:hypothetical protein
VACTHTVLPREVSPPNLYCSTIIRDPEFESEDKKEEKKSEWSPCNCLFSSEILFVFHPPKSLQQDCKQHNDSTIVSFSVLYIRLSGILPDDSLFSSLFSLLLHIQSFHRVGVDFSSSTLVVILCNSYLKSLCQVNWRPITKRVLSLDLFCCFSMMKSHIH